MSINALALFAEPAIHAGSCCECCEGYCVLSYLDEDEVHWDSFLLTLDVGGVEYVTNRYVVVRRDMLDGIPEEAGVRPFSGDVGALVEQLPPVPSERPTLSSALMSPLMLDRFDRAGLDYCGEGEKVVHLYAGDRHAGWTTVALSGGISREQLPAIREFAERFGCSVTASHKALKIAGELIGGDPQ